MKRVSIHYSGIALFIILTALPGILPSAHSQTLGAALNAPSLTWTTSGTGGAQGWSVETGTTEDGVAAAQSGSVSSSSASSTLQTSVTGPGTLTFWWYVQSFLGDETLLLNVNGVSVASATGPMSSWQQQTVYLGAGAQTVKWIYAETFPPQHDGSLGFLDEVRFTAGATLPTITNQPSSQSAVQGLNTTFTIGVEGTPPLSYQWQFDNTNISGATSSSYTVTNTQGTNLGSYTVTVTNSAGLSNSAIASLEFGNISAWGYSAYGQTQVASGATNILAISGGWQHSLALRTDGAILAWGTDSSGQNDIPANLTNVVAIGAGDVNSLALKADGTVLEWGSNASGQTNSPPNLTNAVAIAISTFGGHSLALRSDGTVTAWGLNFSGQTNVPSGLSNVVAVAAGFNHSVALNADGTVVAWGDNSFGETNVPAGLTNAVAIAAGQFYTLALRSDGGVIGWGTINTNFPSSATNLVALAAGVEHVLFLRGDGTAVAWGDNRLGETNVPAGLSNVVAIAAGAYHSLALTGTGPPTVNAQITNPVLSGNSFSLTVPSQSGRVYALEYMNSLTDPGWTPLPLVAGTGANLILTDPSISGSTRFYRVRRW